MTDQVTDRADTATERDEPDGSAAATGRTRDIADKSGSGTAPTGRDQDGADADAGTERAAGTARTANADGTERTDSTDRAAGTDRTDRAAGTDRTDRVAGTDRTGGAAGTDSIVRTAGTDRAAGTERADGAARADDAAGTARTERADSTERTAGTARAAGTERTAGMARAAGTERADGADGTARTDGADGADGAGRAPAADASVARPLHGPDGRDPHLDNVKFVAITLVVAGHAWGPMLAWSQALTGFYLFLYTVHMPIFVMLSGYFSRHFSASPRQARGVVRTIVVPYLLIEAGFTLFRYFFGSLQPLEFALQDPWWVTWFLMTLFFWRVSSPLWRVVRFPIVIAVVVMLAAGTQKMTGMLELGRVFGYLPFFVIGLSLRQEHFDKLRTLWARIAAVPVIAGAVYLTYLLAPHASLEWVYWRAGYEQLDVSYLVWAGIKLAQLAATLLVVAAAIALTPARRIPVITGFGAASIYAYLLHGFITKGADWWSDGYDVMFLHSHLGIALVGLASIVLTLVLCSPPVRVLFSWAIQPRLEGWLRGAPPRH